MDNNTSLSLGLLDFYKQSFTHKTRLKQLEDQLKLREVRNVYISIHCIDSHRRLVTVLQLKIPNMFYRTWKELAWTKMKI